MTSGHLGRRGVNASVLDILIRKDTPPMPLQDATTDDPGTGSRARAVAPSWRSALTPRRIAFPWLAQLYAASNVRDFSPQVKNPVIAGIEKFAVAFNCLGMWHGKQSVWGKRLQARTFDRSLYLLMHRLGIMGADERRILRRFIRAGMTVVDVGANLGLYSLAMADVAGPAGRVISFEPDPDLFLLLRENCAANGSANVEPIRRRSEGPPTR